MRKLAYSKPQVCILNVSRKCALRCSHCFFGESDRSSEMSPDKFRQALLELKSFGVAEDAVAVEGDHTQMAELADIGYQVGQRISIGTSPIFANESLISRIVGKARNLNFSLESDVPEQCDQLRNRKGVYDITLKHLRYAQNLGQSTVILCALSNKNVDRIDGITKLALDVGAKSVVFIYTTPFGNASSIEPIRSDRWREVALAIQRQRDIHKDKLKIIYEPVFATKEELAASKDYDGCSLFSKRICAVDTSSNVYFCPLLVGNYKFALGNLFKESFTEIWNNSAKWREFRDMMKESLENKVTHSECFAEIASNTPVPQNNESGFVRLCYMYWDGHGWSKPSAV